MSIRYPAGFIRIGYDPLKVPDAPTIGTATGGDASASVAFTAPSNVGGSAISAYYAVSNPDQITATGASSPVSVTGLTNGTSYTFTVWALNTYGPSPYSAASGSVTPEAFRRGLIAGGATSGSNTNVIQYLNLNSNSNAVDFGDLGSVEALNGAVGSSTRAVFAYGNFLPTAVYVEFATQGNSSNFGSIYGNFGDGVYGKAALSNDTRGLFSGGYYSAAYLNVIEYITIATLGNSLDFGDLSQGRTSVTGCGSTTRGIFAGGGTPADTTRIDYVTINSAGNATTFGALTQARSWSVGVSSSTRAVFMAGTNTNTIDYVTIASTGNATDFGDTSIKPSQPSGCSSKTIGVIAYGYNYGTSADTNVIDQITIATTGNSTDFGDLLFAYSTLAGNCASNCHGGIA